MVRIIILVVSMLIILYIASRTIGETGMRAFRSAILTGILIVVCLGLFVYLDQKFHPESPKTDLVGMRGLS